MEDKSLGPLFTRRVPRTELEILGKPYVLVAKADFELICEKADAPRDDASRYGKGSIGPDLRARRTKAHMTLSQVARRAGIRLETLSRIENGHTDPSVGTVQAILLALEATGSL